MRHELSERIEKCINSVKNLNNAYTESEQKYEQMFENRMKEEKYKSSKKDEEIWKNLYDEAKKTALTMVRSPHTTNTHLLFG